MEGSSQRGRLAILRLLDSVCGVGLCLLVRPSVLDFLALPRVAALWARRRTNTGALMSGLAQHAARQLTEGGDALHAKTRAAPAAPAVRLRRQRPVETAGNCKLRRGRVSRLTELADGVCCWDTIWLYCAPCHATPSGSANETNTGDNAAALLLHALRRPPDFPPSTGRRSQ